MSPTSKTSIPRTASVPETLEEENEILGTSESQSICSDNGAFAVGNVRFLRNSPHNLAQSFATNSELDVVIKRDSETSLNASPPTGASYVIRGYAQSVDHNFIIEST